ncbi:8c2ca26f-c461-4b79-adf8-4d121a462778 [Sclerotinia trifoliorum]|uniref:8c2ca26f-c461-4b79-adf8-4d121a462778 n=1 Tax=Sclerotinia trifoliorum TaxID=28548 RepID=A0A8H2VNW0_9HELO|nr:8c2ca26f-c461-4b79-adf8-4d121a462778 [Sclerotinia trifoliorum]
MHLILRWLVLVDMVLATSSSMPFLGEFLNPSAGATQNPIWMIGTQQTLSWETSLSNYTIALWNQNSDGNGYSKGPALLELYDGSVTSLNWTVQTYAFSLSVSPVFYLLLQPSTLSDNGNNTVPTTQFIASHIFNITSTTPNAESNKKDHKLGLILALSLTIPFIIICISLAIHFIHSRRRRALENPPRYQYPNHVGFRQSRNPFLTANSSPTFTFPKDNSVRDPQRQGSKTSNNGIYFPPPPTTPKSPLSFTSSLKSLRGLKGNTTSSDNNKTHIQSLSPTYVSYPRSPGGYHQSNYLSPTYHPLQRLASLTSTDAGNPHIQQLQDAQHELATQRQRQGSRMEYQPPEISPYDEPRVGSNPGDQKWIIKPYMSPEMPSAIKKRYHEEQAEARITRGKQNYDEPDELW